ncbi:MAG: hypothetical protein J6C55_00815, partial [Oscillospiraceae bacterium]|nr:hypothetical protein [Oscillospiraceae bacterium]
MNKTKTNQDISDILNINNNNSKNFLELEPKSPTPKILDEKILKKNIKNSRTSDRFITNIIWFILISGFLFGVSYIYFGAEKSLEIIHDWFDKTIQNKSNSSLKNLFLSNIISSNIYIIIIFVLGFSPIFSLAISLVAFLKGLGLGLHTTFIFINYGWRGIFYESIIDIPFNIFIIYIIILSIKESIKFSNKIYNIIKNN